MTRDQQAEVEGLLRVLDKKTQVHCLDIPDSFAYRDPILMKMIHDQYMERTK
jgi:predicted protein tyrosine phosphatase